MPDPDFDGFDDDELLFHELFDDPPQEDMRPWHEPSQRYGDYSETGPDDMIDFPVSPLWLDHYHRQGLTPFGSGGRDAP